MKKYFVLLFVIFQLQNIQIVSAQNNPTRGSLVLVGNFIFSSQGGDLYQDVNSDGEKTDRIKLTQTNPSISYFIFPNVGIGLQSSYYKTSQTIQSYTKWGVGPHILFTFNFNQNKEKYKGSLIPYFGLSYSLLRIKHKFLHYPTVTKENTTKGSTFSLGIGLLTMLSNYVSFDVGLNYDFDSQSFNDNDSVSGNKINISLGIVAFLY